MAARKAKKQEIDEAPSFEEAMKRLSQIVLELEGSDLSLEESLGKFEEGIRLARASQTHLDQAEARVEELLSMSEDGPVLEDIEVP
jgi:exodeoxyribonuclease VII small subunit